LVEEASTGEQAWLAVRLAVRRYARDPSETNAELVELAWRRLRQLDLRSARQEAGPFRSTDRSAA
ncbi:MAG: hypothetical protein MI723_02440, partial [Caulobacterales bacterium]|nr:hypothetical protein [Caulobacterales bacterium]